MLDKPTINAMKQAGIILVKACEQALDQPRSCIITKAERQDFQSYQQHKQEFIAWQQKKSKV